MFSILQEVTTYSQVFLKYFLLIVVVRKHLPRIFCLHQEIKKHQKRISDMYFL